MEEKGAVVKYRRDKHGRLLCFFLGVLLASSIGLAIALGITLVGNDDDDDSSNSGSGQPAGQRLSTGGPAVTTPQTPRAPTVTPSPSSVGHSSEDSPGVCITPSCVLRAGELLQAMDKTVDPCHDFYQYSCGNWVRTHSIPESESGYSRFSQLRDTVKLELRGLLEKPYDSAQESSSIRKAKNMYQSCIDEEKLNEKGAEPLKTLVDQLGTWPLTSPASFQPSIELESLLANLSLLELSPLVDIGVYQDDQNSSQFIIWIDQAALGMDRNYMLKGRNSTEVMTYEELRRQQAIHVLGLTPSSTLSSAISEVVDFEIQLAKMSASQTERRNMEKFYKKKTISELATSVPKFDWLKYLSMYFDAANVTVTGDTEVAVVAEDYLNSMLHLYETTDKRTVANYLLTRIIGGYAGYLSQEIRELNKDLRKVLYGVTQTGARWKSCVNSLDSYYMPTAVGQLYVSTYFTSAAKHKAMEMIGQIREAIKQMISNVQWMDAATKVKALEKADAIIEKIGYPDYQFNDTVLAMLYENVDYQPDAYFQNGLDSSRSNAIDNAKRLLQTPSRGDWSGSASTVNAYYSPSKNSITFPAGILQPPFYGEDFPMSMMFGGIGMVIGHEITHGFDDQGRKYDKEGSSKVWWSQSSTDNYESLASCYVKQYRQQEVVGMHVNGNLTLGENIADNGGIKAAFTAFKRWQSLNGRQPVLPGLGLTHEQLFFVNFAQGWCTLMTDEGMKNRMLTDPHSPAMVRVRVPASNSEDFAKAFSCPVGSPMNPTKKCVLW